jgi:glycosyltransferase involved in cell wall biosynthesis
MCADRLLVTVVTPTFNGRDYIEECIRSVAASATRSAEVQHIIADGGSTDGTVELARSLGVTVLTGKDKGIFDAINKGTFNSDGELVGFLGADDVLLPGSLDKIVDAYRAGGRPWVVGGIRWIDEQGKSLGHLAAPPTWITSRMLSCMPWNPIMHMATYVSRKMFTDLGGFNIEYMDSGDFEFFDRALKYSPYTRTNAVISCFRRTGMNNSVVFAERGARENATIRSRSGPSSKLEQAWWRAALRVWFNVRNPDWMMAKYIGRVRSRFGQQKISYF